MNYLSLAKSVYPQTQSYGTAGGGNWWDSLGTAANVAGDFLGSETGKNTMGLAGLGLDFYQGNQVAKANERNSALAQKNSADQLALQNKYFDRADTELVSQNDRRDEAQDAFTNSATAFANRNKQKQQYPYGLAATGTVV